MSKSIPPVVVGITGASGVIYAVRLVEVLLKMRIPVYVSISPTAVNVIQHELGWKIDLDSFDSQFVPFWQENTSLLSYCKWNDFSNSISSGSFLTSGMVVCPCTGSSMSAIASGVNQHLIHRAAEVHLKERRKLILVIRETPLSLIHLENMTRLTRSGAIILPACPAFYSTDSQQQSVGNPLDWSAKLPPVGQLIDSIIARICDLLEIDNSIIARWKSP